MPLHPVTRRALLASGGALFAWAHMPKIASAAAARDSRFIAVVLRGALDGMAAVAPVGDPDYRRVRPGLVIPAAGKGAGMPLDGLFMLNPNMPVLGELFARGEALIVHAVATPYRDRSHFDGQDVLESGQPGPAMNESGWLNRALAGLDRGDRVDGLKALALGSEMPLILRGASPVVTLMATDRFEAAADSRQRLLDLYRHTDPLLAERLADGLALRAKLGDAGGIAGNGASEVRAFRNTGETAGKLIGRADGPRIGAISLNGWDTHQAEGLLDGRLAKLLAALDQAIDGLRSGLGTAWRDTVVAITTEFGRTARMNGTEGTDHGTATVAILVGGAVNGGRVVTDWPGLSDKALFQGRDLKPTTDLRSVLKGVLRDHLGASERALAQSVFPESGAARPLDGLIAS